jgi:anti-sigma regulatory factor (Ser/Thr protein kinase)
MKLDLSDNKNVALREVEALVQDMLTDGIINQEQFGSMLMALSEAVSNAMNHNPNKGVSVQYAIEDHFVDFSIMDIHLKEIFNEESEVEFFESKYPSLALVKKLSDEVNYNENTHNLQMRFDVSTMQQKLSSQRSNVLAKAKVLNKKENFAHNRPSYE